MATTLDGGPPTLQTPRANSPLSFPSLHLGSFDSFTPEDFGQHLPQPPSFASSSQSPRIHSLNDEDDDIAMEAERGRYAAEGGTATGENRLGIETRSSSMSAGVRRSSLTSPSGPRTRRPATATIRSPTKAEHLASADSGSMDRLLPVPPQMDYSKSQSTSPASPSPSKTPRPLRSRNDLTNQQNFSRPSTAPSLSTSTDPNSSETVKSRPLGPSLTIAIPSNEFPSPTRFSQGQIDDTGAIIRNPSVYAKRRTIVTPSPGSRASEVSFDDTRYDLMAKSSQQRDEELRQGEEEEDVNPRANIERGSLIMPVARPTPGTPTGTPQRHRLEKKRSSADLKNASPTSPVSKRALPRPPTASSIPPSQPPPQPQFQSQAQNADVIAPPANPTTTPQPSTSRLALAAEISPQSRPSQSHRPSIPIVGGLADAGPYAATKPLVVKKTAQRSSKPKEEVCLECMMRDRDLADVKVSGRECWDRSSDADWEDMKSREEDLLKSLGSDCSLPSMDHSNESEEESVPSTGHSLEDDARRRRRREARAAKRKDKDDRVRQLGWRGFKWEERERGEGFPEGFRGTKGGGLTEAGIKNVMTKFPSSSIHRAEYLDRYLYQQAILIRELRAEAKKKGGFTEIDPQLPVVSPRTSSAEWETKHTRELSAHMRGAFGASPPLQVSTAPEPTVRSNRRYPMDLSPSSHLDSPPSKVRPSPSSPADLSSISRTLPPKQAERPATHFYPEREPRARGMSTISNLSTPRPSLTGEYDEFWPPTPDSGLRPFSFAVRAGAGGGSRAGSVNGSDGHGGRRTIFGRFGGSMTSLFGGSQNTGSMIDMHLGLDSDRQHSGHPRTASLASPPRQSFFSRSRASSIAADPDKRISKAVSTSQLSQSMTIDDRDANYDTKSTKGFKGLMKKIRPKHRGRSATISPQIDQGEPQGLAPPPPMSYLEQSNRNRNASSSSMMTDNSSYLGRPIQPPNHGSVNQGFRSVSAPIAGDSSGGSQSASPTSSRYQRRESINAIPTSGFGEMLSPGTAATGLGLDSTLRPISGTLGSGAGQGFGGSTYRPHNKTSSSLSNTSLVTPPIGAYHTYFTTQGNHGNQNYQTLSPPQQYDKGLPPVPHDSTPDFGVIDYSRSSPRSRQFSNTGMGMGLGMGQGRGGYNHPGQGGGGPGSGNGGGIYGHQSGMESTGSFGIKEEHQHQDTKNHKKKGFRFFSKRGSR